MFQIEKYCLAEDDIVIQITKNQIEFVQMSADFRFLMLVLLSYCVVLDSSVVQYLQIFSLCEDDLELVSV